jgi:hypothetical protein
MDEMQLPIRLHKQKIVNRLNLNANLLLVIAAAGAVMYKVVPSK